MALVIGKKNTRKIKVIAEEPGDLLTVQKFEFEVEFKLLPVNDMDQFNKAALDNDEETTRDIAFGSIVSVSGVQDESGVALPWSPELREQFIELPWLRMAVYKAFGAVQSGTTQSDLYKKVKAKN